MKWLNYLRVLLLIVIFILPPGMVSAQAAEATDSSITRINFALGTTSAAVSGSLTAQSTVRYVLGAARGQLMDVTLSAPEGVSLKATRSNGRALAPIQGTSGSTSFRGYLPYTGDYYLSVTSGSQPVNYSLNVFIPVRVSFDRGATSQRLKGHLDAHQGLDYILRGAQGQIMEVNSAPISVNSPLQLIIFGADGAVLRSGMGEGSSFRGELPTSQDYIVSLRAGDEATDFTLDVIIPQRIRFNAGAISGTLRTRLPADRTQYYVLHAMKDQRMQVEITPRDELQLSIYGADGTVLKSGTGEAAGFDGKLTGTQDYILAVRNLSNRVLNYKMRVTIR